MTDRSKNVKLFVGNLPYEVTEPELRNLLQGCGNIRFLIVRKDKQTNKSKGYAHVEYRHEWEAVEAFKRLLGKEVRGRILKVDFCEDVLRNRYPDLVNAATVAFQNGIAVSGAQNAVAYPEFAFDTTAHSNQAHFPYPNAQHVPYPNAAADSVVLDEFPHKRERGDEELLVDEKGRICNKELLHVVKEMNMLDLANVVDMIDDLMGKSLMNTRYILQANPKMEAALIHAKMLLGHIPVEASNFVDPRNELAALFDYFYLT
ncbi:RNA recognition motif domain containing protein [Babesia caballi]|uniref:RNA recognition motif domain containing protein n=1 Tax=Babesia caballi TaxID=5871 RepID=A0AAV4LVN3_BABCB|nr:RNA recognition motif domain containing protein [Babesia caballi]